MKLICQGICALLAVCGTRSLAAAEIPMDQRLPEGVVVLVTCPDGGDFVERFQQTSMGRMFGDEALADFVEKLKADLADAIANVEDETGLTTDELKAIVQGELGFAIVAPRGEQMGIVAMIEYGAENEATMDEILAHLDEELKQANPEADLSVETIEGVDVTILEFPTQSNNPFGAVCYFRNEGQLCFASNVDLIEGVLVRWDGAHSSTLADSEVYGYIMDKCSADDRPADLSYFFHPMGLMEGIFSISADFTMAGLLVNQYIPTLGLDTLQGVGGTFHMSTEEFDTETHTFVYAEQPAAGVFKVFSCPLGDLTPPAWVSADVQQYQCFNWDLQAAYAAVAAMYDEFNNGAGKFDAWVDDQELPGGLHVKDDVIDLFSGKLHFVGSMTDPDDVASNQILIALEFENEEGVQNLLDTLVAEANGQIEERDFQGVTIYEGTGAGAAEVPFSQPAFAIHEELLVIGSSPATLEGVLRASGSESPLSESKGYVAISEHVPDEVSMLGYAATETQFAALYETARSGSLDVLTEGAIDFSSLPPFSEFTHYFTPSGSYAVPDENGALFVGFGLKSEDAEE